MPTFADDGKLKHGLYIDNNPAHLGDLATPSNALEYATAAEDAGWDGVFLADEYGGSGQGRFDPWVTHASIANATEVITFGSWITPLPRRQPWQVAGELAALDDLSDGRVLFGTGLGAPWNYEATGIGYQPKVLGERYDEALEIIGELWRGGPVTYNGTHFSIDEMELPVTPVQQPRIPILMGCWWPNKKPFRRAANWDGIMPAAPSFWDAEGVQGEQPTGTIEEEVQEMVEYYGNFTDERGEIVIPIDVPEAPPDFIETCLDYGMTWALSTGLLTDESHEANLKRIEEGPPGL